MMPSKRPELLLHLFYSFVITGVLGTLKPVIEYTSTNITVAEGRTAILPCSVSNLGRHKVVWVDQWDTVLTFNDQRVIDDMRLSVQHRNEREWNLQLDKVKHSDQGMYTCQVNTDPSIFHGVMLSVAVPPNIVTPTEDGSITVREGEKVTLTCNATGFPRPLVTWYRVPRSYGEERASESCRADSKIGNSGEILVIHNVTRSCGGPYECEADNTVPPSMKRTTVVKVKFQPEVNVANKRLSQYIGKDTILECFVNGYPQATAAWKFGSKQLSTSNKYKLELDYAVEDESKLTLTVTIKDIEPSDFGEYVCFASNDMGEASDVMHLLEYKEKTKKPTEPPPPTTKSITTTVNQYIMQKSYPPTFLPNQNYAPKPQGRQGVGASPIITKDTGRSKHESDESSGDRNASPSVCQFFLYFMCAYFFSFV
ncbi:lachesin-like isoform X2 [Physella acuta]|uniref:lachesin-like isoform X2 n=1 Tax=Physella acuta TaxID=109671 RepID=UPI0027DD198B|nr:lachesin-like isoform X2 [Physella acuta]